MKTKTILPISEARKKIFSIAEEVQNPGVRYLVTERGRPKVVILSANDFEEISAKFSNQNNIAQKTASFQTFSVIGDRPSGGYQAEGAMFFQKVLVVRDQSKVVYLSRDGEDVKHKNSELIKAQLFVELIEKYKYPINNIELRRYVKTGKTDSKNYVEADIVVSDENGNVKAIFETTTFDEFEENQEGIIKNLFDLAEALTWSKKPEYLIYFSRARKNGKTEEKIMTINYSKQKSFANWKRNGKSFSAEIPSYY